MSDSIPPSRSPKLIPPTKAVRQRKEIRKNPPSKYILLSNKYSCNEKLPYVALLIKGFTVTSVNILVTFVPSLSAYLGSGSDMTRINPIVEVRYLNWHNHKVSSQIWLNKLRVVLVATMYFIKKEFKSISSESLRNKHTRRLTTLQRIVSSRAIAFEK